MTPVLLGKVVLCGRFEKVLEVGEAAVPGAHAAGGDIGIATGPLTWGLSSTRTRAPSCRADRAAQRPAFPPPTTMPSESTTMGGRPRAPPWVGGS